MNANGNTQPGSRAIRWIVAAIVLVALLVGLIAIVAWHVGA